MIADIDDLRYAHTRIPAVQQARSRHRPRSSDPAVFACLLVCFQPVVCLPATDRRSSGSALLLGAIAKPTFVASNRQHASSGAHYYCVSAYVHSTICQTSSHRTLPSCGAADIDDEFTIHLRHNDLLHAWSAILSLSGSRALPAPARAGDCSCPGLP